MRIKVWKLPPNEYLVLIGRLVASMAHAETYFRQLLWRAARLDPERGVILTHKLGTEDVADRVLAFCRKYETNELIVEDIERIVRELSELKDARNQVAHRQWHHDQAERSVILSQKVLAKSPLTVEERAYSITELERLCVRAHVLSGMILRHLVGHRAARMVADVWMVDGAELPPAPWLDRSVPRATSADATRRTARKSSRQPRASHVRR
jgi:hypothetical protein